MSSARSNAYAAAPSMRTARLELSVVPRETKSGSGSCNVFDLRAIEADIDHMGHVNNTVYLSWVQDVVVKHWTSLASDADFANTLWVAVRHEITYRRPAFLGDALFATVAATGFQGAKAMFDTFIRRGDQIVAEIKSVWCSLDSATQRPRRVAQDVVRNFSLAGFAPASV